MVTNVQTAIAAGAKAAKPAPVKVNLTNNPEVIAALRMFSEAKATAARAEADKAEAEAIIREALGDATEGIVRGVIAVKVSSERTRKSNDAKALMEAFPEAYAATLRTSTYNFLTVNMG